MNVLSGPHVAHVDTPGNRGLTGVAIIETSHVAVHIWDEASPALVQLDFYTCGTLDKDGHPQGAFGETHSASRLYDSEH